MISPTAYTTWQLLKDLGGLIMPYRLKFAVGLLLRLSSDIIWLFPAYAIATIVTFFGSYTLGDSLTQIWWILGIWIVVSAYHYTMHDLCKYYVYQVAENAALDSQVKTLRHLFLIDISWHERENSGNKLKRIQNGSQGINRIIRIMVDNVIEICVNFIGMIFIIALFDISISIILIVFLLSFSAISLLLTRKVALASYAVHEKEEDLQGIAFESINNIRTIKVLQMGISLIRIVKCSVNKLVSKIRTRIHWYRIRGATLNLYGQIFRLGIVIFIIFGITKGRYEIGFLVLTYNYFNKIWESLGELSHITQDFVVSKFSIFRMRQILDEPIRTTKGKRPFPRNWDQIEVKNLCFGYGDNEVLNKLSFKIKKGERIGIVGVSGVGKSTLFKLLLKQHEDYKGEILIGDRSFKKLKKSSFLQNVAVVLQDTELFNMSLKDNILIASPHKKQNIKHLEKAIKIAHVADFLHKLPQGVDTLIGEKGVKLSGGEKQRLGIARAVYREPKILFLDEATSHLDIESEQRIQDSLHYFFKNITAIVIAHRLSTIKEMDRILVIENGRIVEEGDFKNLMRLNGRFQELWEKQQFR